MDISEIRRFFDIVSQRTPEELRKELPKFWDRFLIYDPEGDFVRPLMRPAAVVQLIDVFTDIDTTEQAKEVLAEAQAFLTRNLN